MICASGLSLAGVLYPGVPRLTALAGPPDGEGCQVALPEAEQRGYEQ